MSHFTVLVKLSNEKVNELGLQEAVRKALLPYMENCGGEDQPPMEYMEFHDSAEEYREEYNENKECDFILTPEGELKCPGMGIVRYSIRLLSSRVKGSWWVAVRPMAPL
jgi:hypothetical protein